MAAIINLLRLAFRRKPPLLLDFLTFELTRLRTFVRSSNKNIAMRWDLELFQNLELSSHKTQLKIK